MGEKTLEQNKAIDLHILKSWRKLTIAEQFELFILQSKQNRQLPAQQGTGGSGDE